jgi:hypothetical protein
MTETKNEGEGNRSAAKRYNEEQKAFVKSGKVDAAAKAAKAATEGPEATELKKAEDKGKSHARK